MMKIQINFNFNFIPTAAKSLTVHFVEILTTVHFVVQFHIQIKPVKYYFSLKDLFSFGLEQLLISLNH